MQQKLKIKKRKEFSYVYRRGKKFSSNYLNVVVADSRFDLKIGFSVSKKVGNSVVRNKIKRRLREICRLNITCFPKNKMFVFVARNSANTASYQDLEKDVLFLLKKISSLDVKGE